MDKEAFAKLPKWKRDNKKKDLSDLLSTKEHFMFGVDGGQEHGLF